MSLDDSDNRRVLSRKELARELRRQAYRKAKESRAKDPRMIAMKEAAKIRRREIYQQVKARKKSGALTKKDEAKRLLQRQLEEKRATTDAKLMELITFSVKGSSALN